MHRHSHEVHDHTRSRNRRRLTSVLLLTGGYMVAELIGGLLANSLALLADAGHMLSDIAALGLAIFAFRIAARPARPQQTYGYYRAEILAAFANGALLIAITIFIFIEAYQRFRAPAVVSGGIMMAVAAGGLAINLLGLRLLHPGRHESLNLRGAWLHLLGDALGSVGALLAGALVWAFGWSWADPLVSVVIGLMIAYSAWQLVAESAAVLMEHAPRGINIEQVRDVILGMHGVGAVHDLHVWTISSGMVSLSAHVVAAGSQSDHVLLHNIQEELHRRFGISHVTIQIEPEDFIERQAPFCPRDQRPS